MHGLFRVRGFTQDDAHIFCLPNQVRAGVCEDVGRGRGERRGREGGSIGRRGGEVLSLRVQVGKDAGRHQALAGRHQS